jgi:hypothetical protein
VLLVAGHQPHQAGQVLVLVPAFCLDDRHADDRATSIKLQVKHRREVFSRVALSPRAPVGPE